jgi:hypothetical protein
LLEAGEEALDAPAVLVGDLVVAVLVLAMAARRDDRLAALVEGQVVKTIGVIGAVVKPRLPRQPPKASVESDLSSLGNPSNPKLSLRPRAELKQSSSKAGAWLKRR